MDFAVDRARSPLSNVHRPRLGRALLVGVPLAFLGVFFLWPVVAILGRGFTVRGSLDVSPIGDVLGDASLRHVVWFTIEQAAISTLATLAIAVPATAVLSRYRFRGRALLVALLTMPFVLPTVVVATAFRSLGIHGSLGAIVIAHAFFNVAVVVRIVGSSWRGLSRSEEDAARVLGASPWRTFVTVTLPALRPAIIASASIVFLFCFTSFGVILILGGPEFATLETEIYRQTAQLLDLRTAAALSVVQLAAVVSALVVAGTMTGRAQRISRPTVPRRLPVGRRALLPAAGVLPALLLVAIPSLDLLRQSFADGAYGYTHLDTLPLGAPETSVVALLNSLRIAAVATLMAVLLGLALAAAVTRAGRRDRIARVAQSLVVLPLGVSAVTVGFGFLIVFDAPPVDLRTSWWIIPIAHALVALPFVVRATVPVLRTIDPRQREAAALLGAPPWRVWREIDLRAIRRAAAVAAGFAFAISLGEFGATLFIVRPDTTTVPVAIYRFLSRPGATNLDQAMALAAILMVITGLVALVGERSGRTEAAF
ncbi:MAG: iron ABC transporter permease [Acidimicrobiia bacterium]